MLRSICTILFFLCCFCLRSLAQQPSDSGTPDSVINTIPADQPYEEVDSDGPNDIMGDTSLYIHAINIRQDTISKWRTDKNLAYMNTLDSLLKEMQKKEKEKEVTYSVPEKRTSPVAGFFSSDFVQVFLWVIAGLFVLFVLFKLFLNNGVFKKSTTASTVNEQGEVEEIITIHDYDKQIQLATRQGDYRTAVRYQFLKTLGKLADRGQVILAPEKTNYQYAKEIKPDRQQDFASLALNYEYIWYGHLDINARQYTSIEDLFTSFNSKI